MRRVLTILLTLSLVAESTFAASFGSGFIVSESGHIITCDHCVPEGSQIAVLTQDGLSREAKVVFRNHELDIACLKIDAKTESFFAVGDSTSAKILDDVFVFGFPLPSAIGNELSASKGTLNAIRNNGGGNLLQIDAPVNAGNSGGPILSSDGAVLGIAVSKLDPLKAIDRLGILPERINFAVPSSVLRGELQRNNITFSSPENAMDFDAMRTLASSATVQIVATEPTQGEPNPHNANKFADTLVTLTAQAAIDYVTLGNSANLDDELSIYASRVDYYNRGVQNREFIRKDLSSLRKRWPERYYVVTSVEQVGVEDNLGTATVRLRFALFNGDKFFRGEATTLVVFDLSDGNPKAVLIREHRTRK